LSGSPSHTTNLQSRHRVLPPYHCGLPSWTCHHGSARHLTRGLHFILYKKLPKFSKIHNFFNFFQICVIFTISHRPSWNFGIKIPMANLDSMQVKMNLAPTIWHSCVDFWLNFTRNWGFLPNCACYSRICSCAEPNTRSPNLA
jgi:hypothetical protein